MCMLKVNTKELLSLIKDVKFPRRPISEYVEIDDTEVSYTVYDNDMVVRASFLVEESTCKKAEFGIDLEFFKMLSKLGTEVEITIKDNFVEAKGFGKIRRRKKEYEKCDIDLTISNIMTDMLPYEVVRAATSFCGNLSFTEGVYIGTLMQTLAIAATDRHHYFCAFFEDRGVQDMEVLISKEYAKMLFYGELGFNKNGIVINEGGATLNSIHVAMSIPQLNYEFPANPFIVESKFPAFRVHESPKAVTFSCPTNTFARVSELVPSYMLENTCKIVEYEDQIALRFEDVNGEEIIPLFDVKVENGDVKNVLGKEILIKKIVAFEKIVRRELGDDVVGTLTIGENFGSYKVKGNLDEFRLYFSLILKNKGGENENNVN